MVQQEVEGGVQAEEPWREEKVDGNGEIFILQKNLKIKQMKVIYFGLPAIDFFFFFFNKVLNRSRGCFAKAEPVNIFYWILN